MKNKIMEYARTAHNRSVYAPLPSVAPGFRSPRSLRSHGSLHPHFCKPWKHTVSFIGLAKTSYTAGTLCAIFFEFFPKIDKNKT
jgi:hypothetical protein